MVGIAKPEYRAEIKRLAMLGLTIPQMAQKAGVSYWSAAYHLNKLVQAGELPKIRARRGRNMPGPRTTQHTLRARYGVTFGRMSALFQSLSVDQRDWLLKQVPLGGEAIDVLRAIIVDTYEEDKDA
jgi:molybdenum-dependent DNA-binding transcriptional regulator ModE